MNALELLFDKYKFSQEPPIILLENFEHKIVGVLYLDKLKLSDIIISETISNEKYLIIVNGVGIYFTYWKKLSDSEQLAIKI